MITLHRLGQRDEPFQLNPDMIVTVESTPDTVIALATGAKVVVAETLEEVAAEVSAYRALIMSDALRRRRPERATGPAAAQRDPARLSAVEDSPA
jgi:flagellar protein FlbD